MVKFLSEAPRQFNRATMTVAADMLLSLWRPACANYRVLTFDKAMETIVKTKSCGWPFGLRYATKGQFYEAERAHCDHVFDRMATVFVPTFTTVFVKREQRTHKKIAENALRPIANVDPTVVINEKRMMQDMHERLFKSNIDSSCGIGWTPYYRGASRLMQHLATVADGAFLGWDFDVKAMDSRVFWFMMMHLLEIRWELLHPADKTEDNRARLYNLMLGTALTAYIMPDGRVFLKGINGIGNNSGCLQTAVLNTATTLMFLFYSYLQLGIPRTLSLRGTRNVVGGDDGIVSVNSEVREFATPEQIAHVLFTDLSVVLESTEWTWAPVPDRVFYSMRFVWNESKSAFDFIVDRNKLFSSMLTGLTGVYTPIKQLTRLCQFRTLTWSDVQMRRWIEHIIAWWHEDNLDLVSTPEWVLAMKSYLSTVQVESLLYGYELPRQSTSPTVDILSADTFQLESLDANTETVKSLLIGPDLSTNQTLQSGFDTFVEALSNAINPDRNDGRKVNEARVKKELANEAFEQEKSENLARTAKIKAERDKRYANDIPMPPKAKTKPKVKRPRTAPAAGGNPKAISKAIAKAERKLEAKMAPMMVGRPRGLKLKQPVVKEKKNSCTISGTIFWSDIGDCTQPRGTLLAYLNFTPAEFPDDEVKSKVNYYENWTGWAEVCADISAPNTNRGNVAAFWDPDPVDDLPADGNARIQTAYRHTKGKSWPLVNGTPHRWGFVGSKPNPSGYYTDTPAYADCDAAERRQNFRARFFLLVNTPSDSAVNPGELSIKYYFKFWNRKLDAQTTSLLNTQYSRTFTGDLPFNMDSAPASFGAMPNGSWTILPTESKKTSKKGAPLTTYTYTYTFDPPIDVASTTYINSAVSFQCDGLSGIDSAVVSHTFSSGTHDDLEGTTVDDSSVYAGCVQATHCTNAGVMTNVFFQIVAPGTDLDVKSTNSVFTFSVTGLPSTLTNKKALGLARLGRIADIEKQVALQVRKYLMLTRQPKLELKEDYVNLSPVKSHLLHVPSVHAAAGAGAGAGPKDQDSRRASSLKGLSTSR
jgi:hypothetical protein